MIGEHAKEIHSFVRRREIEVVWQEVTTTVQSFITTADLIDVNTGISVAQLH